MQGRREEIYENRNSNADEIKKKENELSRANSKAPSNNYFLVPSLPGIRRTPEPPIATIPA
jgi:hypothetical protein